MDPMKEKHMKSKLVSRSFSNYRADDDGNIEGVPIVFDTPTDINGYFEETIDRGAISKEVLKDVAFFFNHDIRGTKPLARTRNKRLRFTIEDDGVHMIASINRERSDANDLYLAIRDGDIDGMSFMFRIDEEKWSDLDTEYPKRLITKIGYVQEVSAVNYPAYQSTSINARSDLSVDTDKEALDNARAKYKSVDTDERSLDSDLVLEKLKVLNKLK